MKIIDNLVDKAIIKRHYLIIEEKNVMEILKVLDSINKRYVDFRLEIGNCGWADEPTKWFIHFDASNSQWKSIVTTLNDKFDLCIKNSAKPDDIFVVGKGS